MAEVVRELAPPPMATAQVAVVHPPKRSFVGWILLSITLIGVIAAGMVFYEEQDVYKRQALHRIGQHTDLQSLL